MSFWSHALREDYPDGWRGVIDESRGFNINDNVWEEIRKIIGSAQDLQEVIARSWSRKKIIELSSCKVSPISMEDILNSLPDSYSDMPDPEAKRMLQSLTEMLDGVSVQERKKKQVIREAYALTEQEILDTKIQMLVYRMIDIVAMRDTSISRELRDLVFKRRESITLCMKRAEITTEEQVERCILEEYRIWREELANIEAQNRRDAFYIVK